jgi:hypothetical protein
MKRKLVIATIAMSLNTSIPQASASEAETLAKVSGALMGMAKACGYSIKEEWIREMAQSVSQNSLNSADKSHAEQAFYSYATNAYKMQLSAPNMTCSQVIQMMRQSEDKVLR